MAGSGLFSRTRLVRALQAGIRSAHQSRSSSSSKCLQQCRGLALRISRHFRWLHDFARDESFGVHWLYSIATGLLAVSMSCLLERSLIMPTQHCTRDRRPLFPAAELAKYRGMWVAFAADGSKILACGDSETELAKRADALGLKPADYVMEPIPEQDTVVL